MEMNGWKVKTNSRLCATYRQRRCDTKYRVGLKSNFDKKEQVKEARSRRESAVDVQSGIRSEYPCFP